MRRKIVDKKGAIELSMTTIIVIVIGVALLSMGLVWIRGVFKQVTGLTEGAFERGEGEISEIFGGSEDPVSVSPKDTEVEQGGSSSADLFFNNLGETDYTGVTATSEVKALASESSGDAAKIVCAFGDTLDKNSESYNLKSGQGVKIRLIIEAKPDVRIGTYRCKVIVPAINDPQNFATLTIKVVPG